MKQQGRDMRGRVREGNLGNTRKGDREKEKRVDIQ